MKYYLFFILALSLFIVTTVSAQDATISSSNKLFNTPLVVGFSTSWFVTMVKLKNDWHDMEGNKNEPFTPHHGTYGMFMLLSGWTIQHYKPELLKNFGIRNFFRLGSLLVLDDIYQHWYIHQTDEYDALSNPTGTLNSSPIHDLYLFLIDKKRQDDQLVLSWFDWPLLYEFSWSIKYYRGLSLSLNYLLVTDGTVSIHATAGTTLGYNPTLPDGLNVLSRTVEHIGINTSIKIPKIPIEIGGSFYVYKEPGWPIGFQPLLYLGMR